MAITLESEAQVDAAPAKFDALGVIKGTEMAEQNPAPNVPSPTSQEAGYIAEANLGVRELIDARKRDDGRLSGHVERGEAAQEDRNRSRRTAPPDSEPWPPGNLIAFCSIAIVGFLGIDALLLEGPWRDFARLPDEGDYIRRFLGPVVIAALMALFSFLSAHGADLAAAARTNRQRLRGRLVVLSGALLLAVPVLIGAVIRTKAEANRLVSQGGIVHPDDAVTFLLIQCALAGLALNLAHAHGFLKRRRAQRRDEGYQTRLLREGEAAQKQQVEFHAGEEGQRNRYLEAIVHGFIVLRRTVETEMVDPVGAAGWAERDRRDLTGFGFTNGGPVGFLYGPLTAIGAGDQQVPGTEYPGTGDPATPGPDSDLPPAGGGEDAPTEPEAHAVTDEPLDEDESQRVGDEPAEAPGTTSGGTSYWDDLIHPHPDDEVA